MDESNATDTKNNQPNESEPTNFNGDDDVNTKDGNNDANLLHGNNDANSMNENDDASSRLSLPIENQPNSTDIATNEECSDSKNPNETIENEIKPVTEAPHVEYVSTEPSLSTHEEPPDPDEKQPKIFEQISTNENETIKCSKNDIKCTEDESQNQSVNDDSEDLLVPTDYVPDIADVISDEPKRKHSHNEDDANQMCKKFKHDSMVDQGDVSMQTDSTDDDLDEMSTENTNELPPQASLGKVTIEQNESAERCDNVKNELNIDDTLTSDVSEKKTIALADTIESVDDSIKKDDKQNEMNNSDLVDGKIIKEEKCSSDVENVENSSENLNSTVDELEFNISEKLKDMGEISLAPVSKTERKPLPDFDLGAEVSLEQISKKATDTDDKRSKVSNMRKNIREVMDDNQLDASTLAAQREELERLARVQEQQRMIREMQRQVVIDRQNSKTQNKVLSLLTGHTSLLKSTNTASSSKSQQATSPTISSGDVDDILSGKSGNLTPSVSISPIKLNQKKSDTIEILDVSSVNEMENDEDIDSDEKSQKPSDDLFIVEDDDTTDEDEDEDEDDDVIELKPKKDIVTIDDSSDDDCIM